MDYEQKYKAALSWMQSLYKGLHGATKEDAEHYFPELKESESEDEEMKKAIKHVLYENYTDAAVIEGVEIAEIVAWLEEQGKKIDDAYLQGICDAKHEIEKKGEQPHAELGQSEVTKISDQELESKKLDVDDVIAWLVANIIDFEYYVRLFKKDFGL